MTEQEARNILVLYRPGSPDDAEPEVVEALALVRQSPALQQWFDEQLAARAAIAGGFRKIPVPEGLMEQILSERKAHTAGFWPKKPAGMVAAVAVLAAIVGMVVFITGPEWSRVNETGFTAYRARMVYTAVEAYRMDIETNDLAAVRSYFAGKQALADWTLPKGLQPASLTGCGLVQWRGQPVSMVCFHLGNGPQSLQKTDTWLFVINETPANRSPGPDHPQFAKVNNLNTATWSENGKTYLLAAQGDEQFLRGLLQLPPG